MTVQRTFAPGEDQATISEIATKFYGGYLGLLKAHGWDRTSGPIMNDASKGIVERYETIKKFETYHEAKPQGHFETAHDLLDAYDGAWMKGFWGWSPGTWGCVGYPSNGRRRTVLRNKLNTRLMFIYVTKSAEGNRTTPKNMINRIVGFYELSEIVGHRSNFQEESHHNFEPKKWEYSIKALRAFSIRESPLPFTYAVEPSCEGGGWGTKYAVNSDSLSDVAYEHLKTFTYEEVPVFGSSMIGSGGLSFPKNLLSNTRSVREKSKPVKGGAPNKSGYYVMPEPDSRKALYILEFCGDTEAYLGKSCQGKNIIKVGLSYSPESRKDFFNRVIPDGSYEWRILRSTFLDGDTPYSFHAVAEKGEMTMKEFFHQDPKNHLSGEFYLANTAQIDAAWQLGRLSALKAQKNPESEE